MLCFCWHKHILHYLLWSFVHVVTYFHRISATLSHLSHIDEVCTRCIYIKWGELKRTIIWLIVILKSALLVKYSSKMSLSVRFLLIVRCGLLGNSMLCELCRNKKKIGRFESETTPIFWYNFERVLWFAYGVLKNRRTQPIIY